VATAVFFYLLSTWLQFSRATTGALMLSGGLANTSFVGLRMIEAFFGKADMSTGILIDQLGSYMVLNTLGITIAAVYSSGPSSTSVVLRRILTFPPLLALVTAIALSPIDFPPLVTDVLKRLADTLVPLALVSVGLQLRFEQVGNVKIALTTGLSNYCSPPPRSHCCIWAYSGRPTRQLALHYSKRPWDLISVAQSWRYSTISTRRWFR
jgi:malate permease and related proteins